MKQESDIEFIDFHNHLELLPKFTQTLPKYVYKHNYSLEYTYNRLKSSRKRGIVVVALYNVPILNIGMSSIIQQISYLEGLAAKHGSDQIRIIRKPEELSMPFTLGIVLSLESARWLKISQLDQLYDLGVKGVQPIHLKDNYIGYCGEDPIRKLIGLKGQGLSEKGRAFIKKLAEYPFWLDLAHMDDQTLLESVDLFSGKLVISHVGARKLADCKRNISHENLEKLRDKGGYLGISAWDRLLGFDPCGLKAQINYFIEIGLLDQLALGSDFGGLINTLEGIDSIFSFVDSVKAAFPDPEIHRKINSKTALRFLEEVI